MSSETGIPKRQASVQPVIVVSTEHCNVSVEGTRIPVVFCFVPFQSNVVFIMVSQELLLDICNIALSRLPAKALFIFLSTVRKYLIRHMLTDRFALSSLGKPSGSSIPGDGGDLERGRKWSGRRLGPGLMLTMLFQRFIMNLLRTRSYLEKSSTVRNMRMLQLSHKLAQVTPEHIFLSVLFFYRFRDKEPLSSFNLI